MRVLQVFKLLVDDGAIPAKKLLDLMQENPKVLEYFNHPEYWQNFLRREVDDPLNEYAFRTAPQRAAADGPITLYISAYHAFPKAKILYKTALTYFSIDLPRISDIISKSTIWKFEQHMLIANRLDKPLMCIWHIPTIPTEHVFVPNVVVTHVPWSTITTSRETSHLSSYHKYDETIYYIIENEPLEKFHPFGILISGDINSIPQVDSSDLTRDLNAVRLDLKQPNINRKDPVRLILQVPLNTHDTNYSISDGHLNFIENGIPWTIDIRNQDDIFNPVWQSVSLVRIPASHMILSCEVYKSGFLVRTEDCEEPGNEVLYKCDIYGRITPFGEPINFANHKENRTNSALLLGGGMARMDNLIENSAGNQYDESSDINLPYALYEKALDEWLVDQPAEHLTDGPIDYEMLEMSNCESASQTRAYLALDDDRQLDQEWQRPVGVAHDNPIEEYYVIEHEYREIYNSIDLISDGYIKRLPSE